MNNSKELVEELKKNINSLIKNHDINNLHKLIVDNTEITLIKEVLFYYKNNKTLAAKRLGIHRNTLHKKIKKLKLEQIK